MIRQGLLALAALLLQASFLAAQPPMEKAAPMPAEPAAPKGDAAIPAREFYRVYVPEARIRELGKGMLPLKREEFERRVAAWIAAASPSSQPAPVIDDASYDARWDGNGALRGRFRWQLQLPGNEPCWLQLGGESLPISETPTWDDAAKTPVVLGTASDGRWMLLAAKSGAIVGGWSLRGERDGEGDYLLRLRPHPALRHRWNLDLPGPWQVTSESRGVVITPPAAAGKPWQAEFRQAGEVILRVSQKSNSAARQAWRQVSRYSLDRAGIDLTAELRLVNGGAWPAWLEMEADPGFQPITARIGEVALTFEPLAATANASRFSIQIPSELPPTAAQAPLEITGLAPPANDRAWRLPRLRCAALAWQEESVRVVARAPLVLEQLQVQDGQQVGVRPLTNPAAEEQQIQLFQRNASITAIISQQKPKLLAETALRVVIGGAGIEATEKIVLRSVAGDVWELIARIPEAWVIDLVESIPAVVDGVPAGQLDSWQLLPSDQGGQPMRLRFTRALAKGAFVQLRIRAHRARPADGSPLSADTWRLSQWGEAEQSAVVALTAIPPYQLEVSGDADLVRLEPASWPTADPEAAAPRAGDLLFKRDAGAAPLRVELSRDLPQFSADCELLLSLTGDRLTEAYQIHIAPGSSPLERVLVRFSRADDRNLPIWTLGDEGSPGPLGRRLTNDESRGLGLDGGGEAWLVQLPRPQSNPFQLRAQRSLPWTGRAQPALVQLPQGARQTGRVVVSSLAGEPLDWESSPAARRLEALPAPTPVAGQTATVRGVYRYDPAVDFSVAMQTGLALIRGEGATADDPSAGSAWAWSARLTSRYQSPNTEHAAEYWIESDGRPQCRFGLPGGAKLRRIEVGRSEVTGLEVGSANRWVVPLPKDQRFISLRIEFTTPPNDLTDEGRIAPPFPELDVPQLDRRWTIWLPPGLALLDAPSEAARSRSRFDPVSPWLSACGIERATPWRPFEASNWLWQWNTESEAELPARQFLMALSIGSSPTPAASDNLRRVNWGAWLRGAVQRARGESDAASTWKFLLDAPALDAIGLRPEAPLDLSTAGTDWQEGGRPFVRRGLALISSPQMLLLTSADRCARWRSILAPTPWPGIWKVAPQASAAWSEQLAADVGLANLAIWSSEPKPTAFPWVEQPDETDDQMPLGWKLYDLEYSGDESRSFAVIRPDFYRGVAWIGALVAFGVAFLWPTRFAPVLPISMGLLAAAGYLAPIPWGDVLLASCAGMFGGAIARWLWVAATPLPSEDPTGEASTRSIAQSELAAARSAMGLLVVFALLLLTARGQAADPPPAAGRILHPVLVPVDDKNQPTGSTVYLPPALYQELLQFGDASRRADEPAWLLLQADYDLLLQEDANRAIEPARFVASYTLETKSADLRIRLPLARQGLHLLPNGAKLDGKPADIIWEGDSPHLELTIEAAGRHRFEVECRPAVAPAAVNAMRVRIPRVPAAQLIVRRPGGHVAVEVTSARGAVQAQSDTERIDLGPIDQLDILWGNSARESAAPVVVADQFQWLRLRRGGMLLETRLRAVAGQAWPASFKVKAAAAWKPFVESAAPAASGLRWQPLGNGLWQVDLPAGERGSQIQFAMSLSDTAGLGDYTVPWVEVAGARLGRAWQGISFEPDLAWEQLESPAPQSIAAADFVAQWGGGVAPPAVAWQVSGDRQIAGRVRVRSQASRTRIVSQEIDFSLARTETLLAIRLAMETTGGVAFQQQVPLAKGLQVTSVQLREPDGLRAVKWSQDQNGALWIRSSQPMAGKYQLDLRAKLPALPIGTKALPRTVGTTDPAPALRIYRQDDTLCSVDASPDWVSEATTAAASPLPGRFIARLSAAAGKKNPALPQLKIDANRPRAIGQMVMRLHRQEDAWSADIEVRLSVTQGVVDRLRFDFPGEFSAPAELRPNVPFDWQLLPAMKRARLSLTPATPLTGEAGWQFTLAWKPGLANVAAPAFEARDGLEIERYLILPQGYELQSRVSGTGRWESAELPPLLRQSSDRSARALRLIGSPAAAPIVRRAPQSGPPSVRLQDISLNWSAGEECVVSAWEMEPAALRECIVQLPAESKLLRASVGGVPVAPRPLASGKWRLPLGPRFLPQRVEVVYRLKPSDELEDPALRSFPAPVLATTDLDGANLQALAVERTLWTIRGPHAAGQGQAESADQSVSPFQQSLERLQGAAAVVARPLDSPSTYSPSDIETWYLPWVRHWIGSQSMVVRQAAAENVSTEQRARMDQLERDQIALAARLGVTGRRNQAVSEAHRFPDAAALWTITRDRAQPPVRLSLSGPNQDATVVYPELVGVPLSSGALAALTALALGLLGAIAVQTRLAAEWLARWPATFGVLVGLAIWWWGGPLGWIGWLVALAALAWSLRVIWLGERRAS